MKSTVVLAFGEVQFCLHCHGRGAILPGKRGLWTLVLGTSKGEAGLGEFVSSGELSLSGFEDLLNEALPSSMSFLT